MLFLLVSFSITFAFCIIQLFSLSDTLFLSVYLAYFVLSVYLSYPLSSLRSDVRLISLRVLLS